MISAGDKFTHNQQDYVVDMVDDCRDHSPAVAAALETEGKDPALYYASKVLKSGKKSKQGGMFYRFTESGNFLKVL